MYNSGGGIMKKSLLFRIVFICIFILVTYYIMLPPINLHTMEFYSYLLFIYVIWKVSGIPNLFSKVINLHNKKSVKINEFKFKQIDILIVLIIFVMVIISNIIFSPLFNSKSYANRIVIDESYNFTEDVEEVDFTNIPLLDKDSSQKLGDRVMGQMPELVSQFYVSNIYTQINYNNDIVRVTPLEYSGFIKWFTNRKDGVKGYITVNSVNGNSNLIKLDKGMKYMPSAYFNENLERHLRFSYPTKIFGKISFEIDNEGKPYWIVPTIKYKSVGLMEEVEGLIILNAVSGKSEFYKTDEIPSWVDQVYPANLIIEQVDDWGYYKNGFINSIFGQKGVVVTTDGYNYMIQGDDVYLYTGITSVSSDEANIGFILTNLRTKETKYYSVPGAEEYSAMNSAEGNVQQMDYEATFPLLINLKNRPTYLISLKDQAGLVKMYAFVDVVDYQKVVVTDSSLGIVKASENYLNNLNINTGEELLEKNITVKYINKIIIDGMTYYFVIDENGQKYKISVKANEQILPFIGINSKIKINYYNQKELIDVISVQNSN